MAQSNLQPSHASEDQEFELRQQLAAAYRIFAHWGWDDHIFTHLSARIPGPENHFLINRFDLAFDEICASNLLKVDAEGVPVDEKQYFTNPAGFIIHSAVHLNVPDAHCVMHLHTEAGQVVSSLADGLLPICQTSMIAAAHGVSYHEFEGVARDLDERARLVQDLGDNAVLILRNHGTLTLGSTVGEAFLRMYFLERACRLQVQALSTGRTLHAAPEGMETFVAGQIQRDFASAAALAWPPIERKVQRLYPDALH